MAEPGAVSVDTGPNVDISPKGDTSTNSSADTIKAFDESSVRALLGQKPEQGLAALASGALSNSTEHTNTAFPKPENPLSIYAPDANGEVTVTEPKLDTDPTNQPVSSEQSAGPANTDTVGQTEPGNQDTTPGRLAQLKNAVTSPFRYKPLTTPHIDKLDLRRPQDTTQTEASTSPQPAEATTDTSAAPNPPTAETQTPGSESMVSSEPLSAKTVIAEAEKQNADGKITPEDARDTIDHADEIARRNSSDATEAATPIPGLESTTTTDQMKEEFINNAPVKEPTAEQRAIDSKTETEGNAEAEKSMRTRRDEVVAQLSRNNPDIDVGDPKVQAMLDEAEGDPAKMEQTEKVLEIVNQKTQESADLVNKLGLPKELVGQLAKGELKSLINVLQEAAKALDADASKKDNAETKNMHWLIKLLLVLAAATIAIPAGAVAVGAGQLQGQSK